MPPLCYLVEKFPVEKTLLKQLQQYFNWTYLLSNTSTTLCLNRFDPRLQPF